MKAIKNSAINFRNTGFCSSIPLSKVFFATGIGTVDTGILFFCKISFLMREAMMRCN